MRSWCWALLITAGAEVDVSPWYGRSIYFVVIDRFAKTKEHGGDNSSMCGFFGDQSWSQWCGGSIRGIIQKLDYIQGMGFDALWITPVVKQVEWQDSYGGDPYHGYWAMDFWQMEPRFGTEEDLDELSQELHRRGMLFMLDVVANHVGPLHTVAQVKALGNVINDPTGKQFHSDGSIPEEGFESYLQSPLSVYTNILDENGKIWYPCFTGNYSCPGYSEHKVLNGWFGDLGDLAQENEYVARYLKQWIAYMVRRFRVDGVRLDTAAYIPLSFLKEFQDEAGVLILGEVVSYNLTYHAQFQHSLKGVLNFRPSLSWTQFNEQTNDVWSPLYGNFTEWYEVLEDQRNAGYTDLFALGNFIDNHDTLRFQYTHNGDRIQLYNALTWAFMWEGIPIFYYGTEQPVVSQHLEQRRSMWFQPWDYNALPFGITDEYRFIQQLNALRKKYSLGYGGQFAKELSTVMLVDSNVFAFTRGDILVVVLSVFSWSKQSFCLPFDQLGIKWAEACARHAVLTAMSKATFSCDSAQEQICFQMEGSNPAIFAVDVFRPSSAYQSRNYLTLFICLVSAAMIALLVPVTLTMLRQIRRSSQLGHRLLDEGTQVPLRSKPQEHGIQLPLESMQSSQGARSPSTIVHPGTVWSGPQFSLVHQGASRIV